MYIKKIKLMGHDVIYHTGAKTVFEQTIMHALNGLVLEQLIAKNQSTPIQSVIKQ